MGGRRDRTRSARQKTSGSPHIRGAGRLISRSIMWRVARPSLLHLRDCLPMDLTVYYRLSAGEHADMNKFLLCLIGVGVVTGSAAFFRWQYPDSPHAATIASAIDDLTSCDYEMRDQAADTLTHLGPEAVPYLVRALGQHENLWTRHRNKLPFVHFAQRNLAAIRERAAEQLAVIAPQDERATRALIFALRDDNPEVQRAL